MEQRQLSRIATDKRKRQDDLNRQKDIYIAYVFSLLLLGANVHKIRRALLNATFLKYTPMLSYAYRIAGSKARTFADVLKLCDDSFEPMRVIAIDGANEYEAKMKSDIFKEDIKEARKEGDVFWVCSEHDDCAKDHLEWQGRLYVDEQWRSRCQPMYYDRIAEFVGKNNIRTVQWVQGAPAWLLTRPNCRHFMEPVHTSEALYVPVKTIISRRGMHYAVGPRQYNREISLVPRSQAYDRQSVAAMRDRYADRLRMHRMMAQKARTRLLDDIIRKDKVLVDKWSELLQNIDTKKTR